MCRRRESERGVCACRLHGSMKVPITAPRATSRVLRRRRRRRARGLMAACELQQRVDLLYDLTNARLGEARNNTGAAAVCGEISKSPEELFRDTPTERGDHLSTSAPVAAKLYWRR